jgi:hypothetical protein
MEQRYYAKNSAGYYREGFLAHGSMSSKVYPHNLALGPDNVRFRGKAGHRAQDVRKASAPRWRRKKNEAVEMQLSPVHLDHVAQISPTVVVVKALKASAHTRL